MRIPHRLCGAACAALLVLLAVRGSALAAPGDSDIRGWEHDSPYGKLYKASEQDRIKGRIADIIDLQPMPGMAPGVGLHLRDKAGGRDTVVHLGPKSAVDPSAAGLKAGDEVKISGAWAEIDGNDIFIAAKVKKGDAVELKLRRTSDGKPYWSMTPDEMEKAKSSDTAARW